MYIHICIYLYVYIHTYTHICIFICTCIMILYITLNHNMIYYDMLYYTMMLRISRAARPAASRSSSLASSWSRRSHTSPSSMTPLWSASTRAKAAWSSASEKVSRPSHKTDRQMDVDGRMGRHRWRDLDSQMGQA